MTSIITNEPLVTKVRDFSHDFPYERLPPGWLGYLLRPEVVLALVALYLGSEKAVAFVRDLLSLGPKSKSLVVFIAVHNLLLAIFSLVTAYYSWAAVIKHLVERSAFDTYCDPDGSLWQNGLGVWATIFYVSKYYEFLDTWILVLKGKSASFLQVYHHAGIVICMYIGVASQSAWLLFVVLLNSVIHTLMYTYFFIKTVAPHVEIKSARYLTMAQIGQFLTGIFSTLGVLWMGDRCDTQSSRFGLACLTTYGFGLIALFVAFANRKYKKS